MDEIFAIQHLDPSGLFPIIAVITLSVVDVQSVNAQYIVSRFKGQAGNVDIVQVIIDFGNDD